MKHILACHHETPDNIIAGSTWRTPSSSAQPPVLQNHQFRTVLSGKLTTSETLVRYAIAQRHGYPSELITFERNALGKPECISPGTAFF